MSHSLQAATKIKPKSASRAIKCIYVGKWSPSDRKLLQRAYFDSVPDALRRLMWITVRTVSKALLLENLKQQ